MLGEGFAIVLRRTSSHLPPRRWRELIKSNVMSGLHQLASIPHKLNAEPLPLTTPAGNDIFAPSSGTFRFEKPAML